MAVAFEGTVRWLDGVYLQKKADEAAKEAERQKRTSKRYGNRHTRPK